MIPRVALLFCALAAAAHASYNVQRVSSKTTGILETEVLPAAEYSVSLLQKVPRSTAKTNILKALTNSKEWVGLGGRSSSSFTATIAASAGNSEYLTNITIGGQSFKVVVDTGSSDLWVAQEGFNCFNLTGYPEAQSVCAFGSDGFDPSESKTFQVDTDKNFEITYTSGEFLTGTAGFDTVTVGGLTVQSQEFGLVTNAAWEGDGVNTGLLGLAYPRLTNIYNGTNTSADVSSFAGGIFDSNADVYNPFFFSVVEDGLVQNPYFSLALDRAPIANPDATLTPHLGYLSFGGIAPVPTTLTAATVPVEGYTVSSGGTTLLVYTVNISSYNFEGASQLTGSGLQAMLDAGTTLNYVPTAIAQEFNSKFIPPATYDEDEGFYFVACNATVPTFSATIGGVDFTVDGKDNIFPFSYDTNGNLVCISGTQDGGPPEAGNLFVLGDTFLHNVVATFNIRTNTVTLTERLPYE